MSSHVAIEPHTTHTVLKTFSNNIFKIQFFEEIKRGSLKPSTSKHLYNHIQLPQMIYDIMVSQEDPKLHMFHAIY